MTLVRGGTGGAVLNGGDRQTLTKSSHFVRDSIVRDCNRWLMNYVRQRFSLCKIHSVYINLGV